MKTEKTMWDHLNLKKRLFLTSPHSGEKVPPEVYWLQNLEEKILMFDVDRYVNVLYKLVADRLAIPWIESDWHRYFSDANRIPSDVDQGSVEGSPNPKGKFLTGLIWQKTSQDHVLLDHPISSELYQRIIEKYYTPFHLNVQDMYARFFSMNDDPVYQLDLHSMPSKGTSIHRDPGETRAEIVVSDQVGKSASKDFVQLVIESYKKSGFQVAYNWPYIGGRVTETYGQPHKKQHCVQVELRRDLYMDEISKQKKHPDFLALQKKLENAIHLIYEGLK